MKVKQKLMMFKGVDEDIKKINAELASGWQIIDRFETPTTKTFNYIILMLELRDTETRTIYARTK